MSISRQLPEVSSLNDGPVLTPEYLLLNFMSFIGMVRRQILNALFILAGVVLSAQVIHAQLNPRFEMHGIRPGMLTREIILQSHAPLDTTLWGGADGASILQFYGSYMGDTGEY